MSQIVYQVMVNPFIKKVLNIPTVQVHEHDTRFLLVLGVNIPNFKDKYKSVFPAPDMDDEYVDKFLSLPDKTRDKVGLELINAGWNFVEHPNPEVIAINKIAQITPFGVINHN